jgi:hypothetical protein
LVGRFTLPYAFVVYMGIQKWEGNDWSNLEHLNYDIDRHAMALLALIFGQFSCLRIHDFPEDQFFHTHTHELTYMMAFYHVRFQLSRIFYSKFMHFEPNGLWSMLLSSLCSSIIVFLLKKVSRTQYAWLYRRITT